MSGPTLGRHGVCVQPVTNRFSGISVVKIILYTSIADYIALVLAKILANQAKVRNLICRHITTLCYERAVLVARQPKKEFLRLGNAQWACTR